MIAGGSVPGRREMDDEVLLHSNAICSFMKQQGNLVATFVSSEDESVDAAIRLLPTLVAVHRLDFAIPSAAEAFSEILTLPNVYRGAIHNEDIDPAPPNVRLRD